MLALRSLLPHLGLFLCLALRFSSSLSASDNGSCVVFDEVYTSSDNSGINTTAVVSGGNAIYTVMVPVNDSVSAVILKAVKENNSPVGTWSGGYQKCNDSSFYNWTSLSRPVFQATWTVPESEDVTKVDLQVFIVINRTAIKSSVRVEQGKSSVLTPTPERFSASQTITTTTAGTTTKTTAETTTKTAAETTTKTAAETTTKTAAETTTKTAAKTTTKTAAKTTTKTAAETTTKTATKTAAETTAETTTKTATKTAAETAAETTTKTAAETTDNTTANTTATTAAKTTARSLAVSTFSNPLAGALHMLLVFLISKLLF